MRHDEPVACTRSRRVASTRLLLLLVVLAIAIASCGDSGAAATTTTTTTEAEIVFTPVSEIPYPRLDLIDRGLVTCVTTGVLALADGSTRNIEECQGEFAFAEPNLHVRQGWVRDEAVPAGTLVEAGHFTVLTIDGVEQPPTGYIDAWDDGAPFVGAYWVLEEIAGDHELRVRWYAGGELFLTSTNLVHFPGP